MFNKKPTHQALPGSNADDHSSTYKRDQLMQDLALDYMKDRKWRRYTRIGLIGLFVVYLLGVFMLTNNVGMASANSPHTALVSLEGVIGGANGVTAAQINQGLRSAFKAKHSKAVILRVNSPGGAPVASADINAEIVRLKAEYPDKPIYTVVADLCASGGYFVAAASDKIFANRSSIVGSIGVRMDSFGFVGTLDKIGVERRSITAGENKAILDPFLPLVASQKAHVEKMLVDVHQHFIDVVVAGRGDKLADNPDLFSGLFWTGEQAKALGLIDDIGSVSQVARDTIGYETVIDYSIQPNFWEQVSNNFGVAIGKGIGGVLSARLDDNMMGNLRLQ